MEDHTPIRIFIGGKEVDVDAQERVGDEIHVKINEPVFFSETGKLGFVEIEMPKRMAV